MNVQKYRVFTLAGANEAVVHVAGLTQRTQERLDLLKESFRSGQREEVEAEIRTALDEWARAVLEIGAQPKGIFTVDFRSPDPNVLWCWAPDERGICHRHFTWESFKDRIPLRDEGSFWPSHN